MKKAATKMIMAIASAATTAVMTLAIVAVMVRNWARRQ